MKWIPWAVALVAIIVAGALWVQWQKDAVSAAEAGRLAQAQLMTEHGLVVAERESKVAVQKQFVNLVAENKDLATQVAKLKAVTPKVVVKRILVTQTVPGPALVSVPAQAKLFAKVLDVGLQTDLGVDTVVGTVEVWKVDPSQLVFRQPFDAKATRLTVEVPPAQTAPLPWWFWGAVGIVAGGAAVYAIRR